MPSLILDFLDFNKGIDYSIIIPLFFIYIFVFWIIISGWVALDARKRYHSRLKGIFMGGLNLVFGLPFLVLYLLVRPMDEELPMVDYGTTGGVNVPVVNFTGKDGVVMSLELKINSQKLAQENASEMKIDVSFDSEDQNKKLVEKEKSGGSPEIVITETVSGNRLSGISSMLRGSLREIKQAFSKAPEVRKEAPILLPLEVKAEDSIKPESGEIKPQQSSTQKKSKKKAKGKKKH